MQFFYPPPDKAGARVIGGALYVCSAICPARRLSVRILFLVQISETSGWISLILYTHTPYII